MSDNINIEVVIDNLAYLADRAAGKANQAYMEGDMFGVSELYAKDAANFRAMILGIRLEQKAGVLELYKELPESTRFSLNADSKRYLNIKG